MSAAISPTPQLYSTATPPASPAPSIALSRPYPSSLPVPCTVAHLTSGAPSLPITWSPVPPPISSPLEHGARLLLEAPYPLLCGLREAGVAPDRRVILRARYRHWQRRRRRRLRAENEGTDRSVRRWSTPHRLADKRTASEQRERCVCEAVLCDNIT